MKFSKIVLSGIVFSLLTISAFSQQCKNFGKKECKKVDLGNYKSNGQLTVASLVPGEDAELTMVFYSGHDYRLTLCAQEHLGDLELSIRSSRGEELFNNQDYELTQDWDFSMTKTQRLIIKVKALRENALNQDIIEEGCLSLIIGHRTTPKSGFY